MKMIPRSIFLKAEAAQDRLVRATFNPAAAAKSVTAKTPVPTNFFVVR